jgi:tetratricopeptide (TPR) repeat protein
MLSAQELQYSNSAIAINAPSSTEQRQGQFSSMAKPNTMQLRSLLNQADANGQVSEEAVQLWIQHIDEALIHNDRVTTQLMLQLLEKLPALPPILSIYREYSQGMLATLRTDAAAMHDYFRRGLEMLTAYEANPVVRYPPEKVKILKGTLLVNLANALVFASNLDDAETFVLEALPLLDGSEDSSWLRPQVRGLTVLFKIHYCRGQIEKALNIGQQALGYARQCGDQYSIAKLLQLVGICHLVQSEFEVARVHFEECLVLSKIIGHNSDLGTLHNNLAVVYEQLHSYKEALAAYETALTLCTARGDKPNMVAALTNIGSTSVRLERYPEAYNAFIKGLKISREIGDPSSLLLILSRFVSFLVETTQRYKTSAEQLLAQTEARELLTEALILERQTENIRADYSVEIYTHLCRAAFGLALTTPDYECGYFFWRQAVTTCQQLGSEYALIETSRVIAGIFLAQPLLVTNANSRLDPIPASLAQPITAEHLNTISPEVKEKIYQILTYWWQSFKQKELLANSPQPLDATQLNYSLNYARLLVITGKKDTALSAYRSLLSRLLQTGSNYGKAAEIAYLEAARIAQPPEAAQLLEEFLLFVKAGLLTCQKPKEIENLLKSYRKISNTKSG